MAAYKAKSQTGPAILMRSYLARVLISCLLPCLVLTSPAEAGARWTFCVASALGSKDIWITNVFAALRDRERLEGDLKSLLTNQGAAHVIAQCPSPQDDKTEVVNAQLAAADFNRKLGNSLHEVDAPEFEPRR
jgi:hypothetical protein